MGGTKDMWIGEYETIGEEYASSEIEREEAVARLKALGFCPSEIQDQLDALTVHIVEIITGGKP